MVRLSLKKRSMYFGLGGGSSTGAHRSFSAWIGANIPQAEKKSKGEIKGRRRGNTPPPFWPGLMGDKGTDLLPWQSALSALQDKRTVVPLFRPLGLLMALSLDHQHNTHNDPSYGDEKIKPFWK